MVEFQQCLSPELPATLHTERTPVETLTSVVETMEMMKSHREQQGRPPSWYPTEEERQQRCRQASSGVL